MQKAAIVSFLKKAVEMVGKPVLAEIITEVLKGSTQALAHKEPNKPMVKDKKYKKPHRIHFSLGNSSAGPVGYCAAVIARSRADAVKLLKSGMPEEQSLKSVSDNEELGHIEYIEVYFNDKAITMDDIDEEEPA